MQWLLLLDPPMNGEANMNRDRELLRQHIQQQTPPLLRFYHWEEPTVSLGRFQKASPELLEKLKEKDIPWVKRPTGGQAVWHKDDFTFSFIASESFGFERGILNSHCQISKAIRLGLKQLDIEAILDLESEKNPKTPNCFATITPADLQINGKKLVGSAQTRKRGGLLQQTTLYKKLDIDFLQELFSEKSLAITSLEEVLKKIPEKKILTEAIISGFSKHFGVSFIEVEI